MRSTAAGAPIRAIGALAILWILTRLVAWTLPANIAVDSVEQIPDKAAFRADSQMGNVAKQILTGGNFPAAFWSLNHAGNKPDIMILSNRAGKSNGQTFANWPASPGHPPLLLAKPEVDGGGRQLAESPLRARSLSQGIAQDRSPEQNLSDRHHANRIHGYFWIFARQDFPAIGQDESRGGTIISNGQYGGSQIGAILSYPILKQPGPGLAVYGRLTAALAPLAQEEIALGARLNPIHNLPVSIHAEQRLDADSGGDRGMAVYVVAGTGPDEILENIALETYAQAGYILGQNETYFFDGSATLQRPIAITRRNDISVGAGIWAGGQRKITRVDIGPRADFSIPLGGASAQIAIDWRVRVAGEARPGSGMAITVSTGF